MSTQVVNIIEKKSAEYLTTLFIKEFKELLIINENFVTNFSNNFKEELSRFDELKNTEQIFNFYLSQNESNLTLLKNYYDYLQSFSVENSIKNVHNAILSETENVPTRLAKDQDEYHFNKENVAGTYLKLMVSLKYKVFKMFRFFSGAFKGKEYKNNYKWNRDIPLKEAINFYYTNRLLANLDRPAKEIIKKIGGIFIEINDGLNKHNTLLISGCFNNDNIKESLLNTSAQLKNLLDNSQKELFDLIDDLSKSIETEINSARNDLLDDIKILGTLALPYNKYSSEKNGKLNLALNKKYELIDKRKNLYYKSIFNKCKFSLKVNLFQYPLIIKASPLISSFKINLFSRLEKILASFDSEIDNAINDLKSCSGSKKDFSELLINKKNILHEKIDKALIVEFVNILKEENYAEVLSLFLKSNEEKANIFSKIYLFAKPEELIYGIGEKQLHKFSPKLIVQSLFLSSYNLFIKNQIEESKNIFNSFSTKIINLGHVTEYSLNAALEQLEREEIETCLDTAEDGLTRVKNRKSEIYETFKSAIEEQTNRLKKITETLLTNTNELKNTENIINLKIRASKEKAVADLKNLFNDLFGKSKIIVKKLYSDFMRGVNFSLKKYSRLKTRVGLADKENEISESISEYFSETTSSLDRIPPVYKNLFSNVQINDELIFVGRKTELDKFNYSFNKWCSGKLSSLIIVGEKGSGTSSLFNIASKNFDKNIKLCRREFSKTIPSENVFIEEISKLLKITDVNSTEEIIEKINNFEEKHVALIENLEDFYIKTINGFTPIYSLIDIMTATHNKIFWVATCAKYSWNYLVRVVNIQDYFIFKIELNELTENELEEIIYKRHNISGYNLSFIPTNEEENAKAYKKLNDKEKAVYLKEKYFETITKLTQGNIALSLFLWLRSIEKIDDNTIYVSTSINIDFSFLNNLTDTKIFTIASLIIHDGLTYEEHSEIFNISRAKSKLIFDSLVEDGIIFKRNDKYKINFQLYRPLVNLLKNRNIFH